MQRPGLVRVIFHDQHAGRTDAPSFG
jgi:hypothetical protein